MSDDLYVAAERVAGRIADGDFAGGKKLLREVLLLSGVRNARNA